MSKNVLFEIGLEELPARFIDDAERQLVEKTEDWLQDLRVPYDSIRSFSTPRRLAVLIKGIAAKQTTIKKEVRGPSEEIAKDNSGNWTKAAMGFTKGQGKIVDDIFTRDIKGTTYIFIENNIEGQRTIDLLPTFKNIIESIQFKENMHWAKETLKYARPIRWLVALYGDHVVPFEIANVKTNNITYGHRFLGRKFTLKNPLEYQEKLRENFVIADGVEREQQILMEINKLESKKEFQISIDQELLNEVRNLVEFPTVFCGSYDESFLQLPSEILITSMKEHQRYFPVKSSNGKILPYFIGVRNGNEFEIETVIRGNEKVLHARLSDAQFFYEEDQKSSIALYQEKLTRVVFQEKLGTISEKVKRVEQNTKQISQLLNINEDTITNAVRAAEISKFDLMTNVVNEFTELQGIIGEKYAIIFGENKVVAKAIREHYLPNQANGTLPESLAGAVVSIADKLDTIIGFISVGLTPTGSHDPYALRRQALGILRILKDRNWNVTLESLIEIAYSQYIGVNAENNTQVIDQVNDFFKLRATYLLKELAVEQDVTEAVLHNGIGVFPYAVNKATLLSKKRNDPNFKITQEALVRVQNLARKKEQTTIDPNLFETSSEELLFEQFKEVSKAFNKAAKELDAKGGLLQLSKLAEPIHTFFEHNMVMAEDKRVRENRLTLVNSIAMVVNEYADLSVIQWKQQK